MILLVEIVSMWSLQWLSLCLPRFLENIDVGLQGPLFMVSSSLLATMCLFFSILMSYGYSYVPVTLIIIFFEG